MDVESFNATAKPKTLAEVYASKQVQDNIKEMNKDREYVKMEDVFDRLITITKFEITSEESKFGKREIEEFTRIYFYFEDDAKKVPHSCRTQSFSLRRVLEAVTNDVIQQSNGITTMIVMEKHGAKTLLKFAEIE